MAERSKERHGSGSVRWRAGAWRIQVFAGWEDGGKPRLEYRTVHAPNTAAGRRTAETAAREIYDEIQRRGNVHPPGSVGELMDKYIEHRQDDWADGQAERNRKMLERRLEPIAAISLDRLTTEEIDRLYRKLRRDGLSVGSVRRTHGFLHAALEQALKWRYIPYNPAHIATLDRQEPPPAKRLPKPEALRSMIAAAEPDMAVIIRLGVHTGARTGELLRARWVDLDHDEQWIRLWQSKTRREKFLALGDATTVVLKDWRMKINEIHEVLDGQPAPDDWWVFPSPRKPDQHLGVSAVSHTWARLRDDAGLARTEFKILRKTMSTVCLTNGVDIRTVMGRGGWSAGAIEPGAAVMLKHYAQMVSEADRRAAKILDDWLDRSSAAARIAGRPSKPEATRRE